MKILNRFSQAVIWDSPCSTMRATVEKALAAKTNLTYATLRYADLRSADLTYADLTSADLRYADLTYATLTSATLRYANLTYADLTSADLTYADLTYATLRYADLTSADLTYADLTSADLRSVRSDFLAEVLKLPNELEFLRAAIMDGRIDGSTYSGECACLAGTMAHAKGIESYYGETVENGMTFTADSSSPRERFFLAIAKGDTPETNGASKVALEWTDEAIAIRDNIRGVKA